MPAIFPAFEHPLSGADDFSGQTLSRALKQLDEIAVATKVKPLSRFIDARTMAHEFLDGEQLATMTVPSVVWYELNDGLETVRAILAAIENNATRFPGRRGDETEAVTSELRQLEGLLASVANETNRFHLLIDM
jgi:hypothetical protein